MKRRNDEGVADVRPLVIKAGGTTIEDAATAPALYGALVELSRRPGGVVFVHGGGRAVDRHLERLGMTSERREGIRITPPEQVEEIAAVLAGSFNKRVVAGLNMAGARAVGLCLGDGRAIATRKTRKYAFDAGRVGEVESEEERRSEKREASRESPPPSPSRWEGADEGNLLTLLVANGFLPVVSSIGIDAGDGGFLNVNADDAAAGIAQVLGARALVLLTDVPGILDGAKQLVGELTARGIEEMIERGEIKGGMIVKARAAAEVAQGSGVPVVIMAGNDVVALGKLGRGEMVGTRIVG